MTFGQVHVSLWITLPLGITIAAWTAWFWWRQGRPSTPSSRRYIRRTSSLVILLAIPVLIRGLSIADPTSNSTDYVRTWLLLMLILGIVLVTALIDVVNNLRIHQRHQEKEMVDAAAELAHALRNARNEPKQSSSTSGPHS